MSNIKHEQLSEFQKRLREASRAQSPVYSVLEVVTKACTTIEQARQRNVSWEKITQMLNESTGRELSIQTVKNYYFRVQRALKEGAAQTPKAPRPKAQASTRKPKPQTQAGAEVRDIAQPTAQVSAQAIAPSDQPASPPSSDYEQTLEPALTVSHFAELEASQSDGHNASPQGASVGEWVEPEFNVNRVRPNNQSIAV